MLICVRLGGCFLFGLALGFCLVGFGWFVVVSSVLDLWFVSFGCCLILN